MNSVTISQMLDFSEKIARKYNLLDRKENKMFNLFKKKQETKSKPMNHELFSKSNVEYFYCDNRKKIVKKLQALALYHGYKLKYRTGLFVSNYSEEIITEPVLRVELLKEVAPRTGLVNIKPTGRPVGRPRKDDKKGDSKRKSKYNDIVKLLNEKVRVCDIAKKLDVSRSYIHLVQKAMRDGE